MGFWQARGLVGIRAHQTILIDTSDFIKCILGCLFSIPEEVERPPFEDLQEFINNFVLEEIVEPCVDVMCPRTTGRSILRNKVATDIRIAFYSCQAVGYSLADMTPDIKLWLKEGLHGQVMNQLSSSMEP